VKESTKQIIFDDVFFYIEEKSGACIRAGPQVRPSVNIGEKFGIFMTFTPEDRRLSYGVRLTAPHSIERFPSRDGLQKFSADCKTTFIESSASGKNGFLGFCWGIGLGDPIGLYEMVLVVEGEILAAFQFKVLSDQEVASI
jgi:hypothetical protein